MWVCDTQCGLSQFVTCGAVCAAGGGAGAEATVSESGGAGAIFEKGKAARLSQPAIEHCGGV